MTGVAAALTLTGTVASQAAMTDTMAAEAAATMKNMATHVATWQAANPGQTYTVEQLHAAFPQQPAGPGVIWVGLVSAPQGYCFMAVDSTKNQSNGITEADSRFLESTTAGVFIPTIALLFGSDTSDTACAAAGRNKFASVPVTSPQPFHSTLLPAPPVQPPAPAPEPTVDPAKVRAAMVKDVGKAKRLITRAQKKKASARPTLKQLRKAGLKPSAGTKLTVKYLRAKPRLYCVRAVNPDAGLKKRHAVWFDSGLRKVVTGAEPKGKRSACARL